MPDDKANPNAGQSSDVVDIDVDDDAVSHSSVSLRREQTAEHLRSPEGIAATAATTAAAAHVDASSIRAAATTSADALTAHGQRSINRIWEYTQAVIALGVVAVTMVVVLRHGQIPPELIAMAASIVSTYFTRTNHSAVGGVGPPQQQQAERRGE